MARLSVHIEQLYFQRIWPNARCAAQPCSATRWATLAACVCIALLNMLSLLPCVNHCTQDEARPGTVSAWFLCDLCGQPGQRSLPEPPIPHHHHAPPRTAFEPILVHLGLITTMVLLISRLFTSASPLALRLGSTPPTPPPRAA
jgi:hypothetical protein